MGRVFFRNKINESNYLQKTSNNDTFYTPAKGKTIKEGNIDGYKWKIVNNGSYSFLYIQLKDFHPFLQFRSDIYQSDGNGIGNYLDIDGADLSYWDKGVVGFDFYKSKDDKTLTTEKLEQLANECIRTLKYWYVRQKEVFNDLYGDYDDNYDNDNKISQNELNNLLNTALKKIKNGESPEDAFDVWWELKNGFIIIGLQDKYNYINKKGNILSKQWFDNWWELKNGLTKIELNGKYNVINTDGKIISNQWFDYIDSFKDGFAGVRLNGKYNFINTDGKMLSNQWFDRGNNFKNGFASVCLNDKYNFINTDGEILSKQWFDNCGDFYDGYAYVRLNGSSKFVDTKGKLHDDRPANESKKRIFYKNILNETSISTPRARYRSDGSLAFYKNSNRKDIIEMSEFAFAIARTVIKRSKHSHEYADLLEDILTDFTFSTAMHGAFLPDLSDTDKLEKDMGDTQGLVGYIIDNYK